ncbi:hypothetical protein TRFO_29751 [Tritrichomonas foetus]|uniref:Uncharacterized protein n=1 Tax=Tritrichomonas foetus TaxID=1144522 RepID=A0A1J4JX03_9EUKA|nr:hypothetical protein TRFO_29751 [Tritrichomonas foetus]|eukprot:OHT02992.1 hypothetical protein TRFO_29751 [Tritrichomonas foetus]
MALLQRAIENSYRAFANSDSFLLFLQGQDKRIIKNGIEFILHYFDPSVNNTSTNPPRVTKRDHLMPPYEPYIELDRFTTKEQLINVTSHHNRSSQNDQNSEKDQFRDVASPCHFLILNRYQFCPGHVIMSLDTTYNFKNEFQGSPLIDHDYSMLSILLHQVDDRGVAYYNGGVDAGCTQYHKHMQYVPNFYNPLFDKMALGEKLPYKYFTEKIDDYRPETIGYAYKKLMERMDHSGSYNLVISNKVAAIVPRIKAKHRSGVVLNSMGICGHLSVWNYNAKPVEENPLSVFEDCCIPVD